MTYKNDWYLSWKLCLWHRLQKLARGWLLTLPAKLVHFPFRSVLPFCGISVHVWKCHKSHDFFQNLLFASDAEDAELKVVDFGFARLKPREGEDGMRTPCFTLQYAAPEVLDQSGLTSGQAIHGSSQSATSPPSNAPKSPSDGYNESCDLWSLGVILVSIVQKQLQKYNISDYWTSSYHYWTEDMTNCLNNCAFFHQVRLCGETIPKKRNGGIFGKKQ